MAAEPRKLIPKKTGEDGNDLGLTDSQVKALEKLTALGAEPAYADEEGKTIYSKDPQTRALQLVFEGRFGGAGRGQGRPKRAAEEMAEHIRRNFKRRMTRALGRALSPDAGTRANLDAIRLAIDIEKGERKLQIEEEEHEGNIGNTREELLATLFSLVNDPATAQAIAGVASDADEAIGSDIEGDQVAAEVEEEITDAEVIEEDEEAAADYAPAAGEDRSEGTATPVATNGSDSGSSGSNGRGRSKRDRQASPNPFTQAALRRSAERRRTT